MRKKGGEMGLSRQTIKQTECPECGNKAFVYDSKMGEVICTFCGYVLGKDHINRKQEWRAYTQEEWEKRSRAAPNLGQSTQIGDKYDSRGMRKFPSSKIRRLKKHQRRAAKSKEAHNIRIAEPELQKIISKLHLPSNVKELATVVYKMASEQNLIRGRTVIGIVAASIYFACRLLQIPRPLSEFSQKTGFSEKEIARDYRFLHKELAHKLNQKLNIKVQAPSYLQLIDPITENLQISIKTARLATEIIKAAEKKKITHGKDPKGMTAAAIYIACVLNKEKMAQKEIADEAQVTEVTLRNRYKELKEKLLFEISL